MHNLTHVLQERYAEKKKKIDLQETVGQRIESHMDVEADKLAKKSEEVDVIIG